MGSTLSLERGKPTQPGRRTGHTNMLPHIGPNTNYSGNQLGGHSINFLGNVHGDVRLPGGREDNQCLRDLKITDPRADMERIKHSKDELLTDCYAWILEDPEFRHWREQPDTKRLWIKGDPGKGKTMIMIGVINELLRSHKAHMASTWIPLLPTCAISYYFCEIGRPEQNTAVAVLRGLIYMLVKQRPGLIKHVEKHYGNAERRAFEDANAIWTLKRILSEILNDATLPRTYLLIDALDECSFGLEALLQIITDDNLTSRSDVKWLVTSRNLPHIERLLRANSLRTKISLELNPEHVSRAVSAFIRFKVEQLAQTQQYDPATKEIVDKELNRKAQGTFLWASLVCKELAHVPLWLTEAVLEEIPPGLNSIYDRMMGQLNNQRQATVGLCIDILVSVTLAFRPLRLEDLIVTAGLPGNSLKEARDLVSHCGSFVIILEDVVSFVHLSARDYFTSGRGTAAIFSAGEAEEHEKITDRLMNIMSRKLHRNMCGLRPGTNIHQKAHDINDSVIPSLRYACRFWVNHLDCCIERRPSVISDNGKVHEFLKRNFLHWIEAMIIIAVFEKQDPANFYGNDSDSFYGDVQYLMHRLISQLETITRSVAVNSVHGPECDVLLLFLKDGLCFIDVLNTAVWNIPLQLYYSVLLLDPGWSTIRRMFAKDLPVSVKCSFFDETIGQYGKLHLSSRGDMIASTIGQKVILLEARTGQLLQTLTGGTQSITCTAFSPQGNRVASASMDNKVRLWDAETGQLIRTLAGHTDAISCIAFSWLGNTIASGSWDTTVRLWDVKSGQQLRSFTAQSHLVRCIAVSREGDILASLSMDGIVRLWKIKSGRATNTLIHFVSPTNHDAMNTAYFHRLAFSKKGDQIMSVNGVEVRLWDTRTGTLLEKFSTLACLSPDSPQVCSELIIQDSLFVRTVDAGILSGKRSAFTTGGFPQGTQLKHILVTDERWLLVDGEIRIWLPDNLVVQASTSSGRVALSNGDRRCLWILDVNCT